ncbi:hypothetical protein BCR37DRAFT_394202 [Protomyces lactucae-debilis]|uniref:Uncharacterized protein n=1 Tax=Protomyces lactucae-debilis TaxID=2754530 RepID=A0A1Y2F6E9_PROLT|nr:uncharacterized protein BCR37DRAFT_394202 [Protomyces lactucae-debilis]ORY79480.1 hypothetical protein BCR37DRAFT_394202 [Protomyces lactucae-debilis]
MPALTNLEQLTALVKRQGDYIEGSGFKKQGNWAARNAGIVLVFCIAAVLILGVIFFTVSGKMKKRRERAEAAKARAGA